MDYSNEAVLDPQGTYFWHLVKLADWTRERVEMLMLRKFKATHWNALDEKQRRQMIGTMKSYADKQSDVKAKKIRQCIGATASALGLSMDQVHELMQAWGFGTSLRKLNFQQTMQVYENIKKCQGTRK